MATDREMLERIRDGLQKARDYSHLAKAMYVTVIDHLAKPQPTNNTIEAWLACDGDGCAGVYEIDPEWDAENHEFDWQDGWFFSFQDDGFDAIFPHVEPGHKVKIRLTVEPIGEPVRCDNPEPKWQTEIVSPLASTVSSADGVYRFTGRDHVKRAAELAEYLNSKES